MPGGYGRGRRYRRWYRETGVPGWMRDRYPPYDPGYMPPWDIPPLYPPAVQRPRYMGEGYPEMVPEDELKMLEEEEQMLEEEKELLEKEVEEIGNRIKELKKEVK